MPHLDRAVPALRRRLVAGLTVFIFHEVTDEPSQFHRVAGTNTTPDVFRAQLDWILDRFTVIAPTRLPQLGGAEALPDNAALITFDDAWAGTFRTALPMVRQRGIDCLCFLNMGTVAGDPDLAAALRYQMGHRHPSGPPLDVPAGDRLLAELREGVGQDPSYRAYQGETVTLAEVEDAVQAGGAWFASHLYHHWSVSLIRDDLYRQSLMLNEAALATYPNHVRAFATPHGYAGENRRDVYTVPASCGVDVVFTGRGNQNRRDGHVLDRVLLPPDVSSASTLWYATHRRRVLGRHTS